LPAKKSGGMAARIQNRIAAWFVTDIAYVNMKRVRAFPQKARPFTVQFDKSLKRHPDFVYTVDGVEWVSFG
jgi:hypothetical protein